MRLSINASAHICRWICFSSSPNQTAQCFILRAFSSPLRAFRTIIFKHLLTIFTLEIIWLHDSGPSTRRICDLFLFERRHNWTKHHVTVRGALKVCNKYKQLIGVFVEQLWSSEFWIWSQTFYLLWCHSRLFDGQNPWTAVVMWLSRWLWHRPDVTVMSSTVCPSCTSPTICKW